jgi:hypothetical protein
MVVRTASEDSEFKMITAIFGHRSISSVHCSKELRCEVIAICRFHAVGTFNFK